MRLFSDNFNGKIKNFYLKYIYSFGIINFQFFEMNIDYLLIKQDRKRYV